MKWWVRARVLKVGDTEVYRKHCVYLFNHRSWGDFIVDQYVTEGRSLFMSRCRPGCAPSTPGEEEPREGKDSSAGLWLGVSGLLFDLWTAEQQGSFSRCLQGGLHRLPPTVHCQLRCDGSPRAILCTRAAPRCCLQAGGAAGVPHVHGRAQGAAQRHHLQARRHRRQGGAAPAPAHLPGPAAARGWVPGAAACLPLPHHPVQSILTRAAPVPSAVACPPRRSSTAGSMSSAPPARRPGSACTPRATARCRWAAARCLPPCMVDRLPACISGPAVLLQLGWHVFSPGCPLLLGSFLSTIL